MPYRKTPRPSELSPNTRKYEPDQKKVYFTNEAFSDERRRPKVKRRKANPSRFAS